MAPRADDDASSQPGPEGDLDPRGPCPRHRPRRGWRPGGRLSPASAPAALRACQERRHRLRRIGPRHPCPGPGNGRHDLVGRRVRGRPSSPDLAGRDEAPVPAGHDDLDPVLGGLRAGDHGGERGRQQRQAADRRLENGAGLSRNVAWSGDGSKVAVSSGPAADPVLQVFTVDGSVAPVTIDVHGRTAEYLAFRPGDRELIFRGMNATDPAGMFAVGADGRGFRTIIAPAEGDSVSLSPDGTKIAYQTWDGTLGILHIVDVDTGIDSVPAFDPPARAGLADDKATWSPDGTRLVFVTYTGGTSQLSVAPANGGPRVQIGPRMSMCECQVVVRLLAGRLEGPRSLRRRRIDLAARPDGIDRGHAAPVSRRRCGELATAWLPDPALIRPDGRRTSRRAGRQLCPARRYNRGHGPPRHPDPRRRHRSRAGGGHPARPRRVGRRVRVGGPGRRRGRHGRVRDAAPGARPRVDPAQQGRAQGPDHHAGRRGLPERQRHAPPDARPVRQPAAGALDQGPRDPLRRRRPRDRPREHGRPVRGHRAHGRPGRRREHQDHHPRARRSGSPGSRSTTRSPTAGTRSRPCTRRTS